MDQMQEESFDDYDYQNLSKQNSESQQQVQILTFDEVIYQFEEQIRSIQEMIPFSIDNIVELFMHYNWNQDNINNEYLTGNQEKILHQLKLSGEFNDHAIKHVSSLCPVCLEHKPLLQFSCTHAFCQDCLRETILERIDSEGFSFVRCLQDHCKYRLPYSYLCKVSPSYKKILCSRYIEQNKNLAQCTGVDCNLIVKPTDTSSKDITCQCGNVFCFRCKEDLHPPAPCDIVQKWLTEVRKDEANLRWISINTKICPFCKKPVERSEGCNYMMCKPPGGCGKAFCYVCGNPWEPDHKDHFKCTKYKDNVNKGNSKSEQQEILKRYNFYYERFLNSEAARRKAVERKSKIEQYQKDIFDIYGFTYQDSTFLISALQELIDSRVVLKWSFCLGYYINYNNQQQSKLYDNYQDIFEHACESLAINLVKLFETVELMKIEYQRMKQDIHEMKMEFTNMKDAVQVAKSKCHQYRENLEASIYNGNCF